MGVTTVRKQGVVGLCTSSYDALQAKPILDHLFY